MFYSLYILENSTKILLQKIITKYKLKKKKFNDRKKRRLFILKIFKLNFTIEHG